MPRYGQVRVDCQVLSEVGRALEIRTLPENGPVTSLYIPISQVTEIHRNDGWIVMAEWLAKKEGLI